MTTQPEFGARVRKRRKDLGLSQRQLAGDAMTASYVSLLEAGRRAPTLDVIIHLATQLRLPLEELIGLSVNELLPAEEGAQPRRQNAAAAPAEDSPMPSPQIMVYSAQEVNDFTEAIDGLRALRRQARDRGEEVRSLEFGFQLQGMLRRDGHHEERVELLEEMLTADAVQSSTALQVTLLTHLATAQRDIGWLAKARTSAETAHALVQPAGLTGRGEHVRLLGVLVSTLCELNDTTTVPDLLDEMTAFAQALGIPGLLGRSLWVAAMALSQLGQPGEASDLILQARSHLSTPTLPLQEWLRFSRSATDILVKAGRHDEARGWLDEAESTTRHLNLPAEDAAYKALQARYRTATGDLEAALDLYTELTGTDTPLTGLQLAKAYLARAGLLQSLGRASEAVDVLREAARICEENGALQLAVQMWRQIDEIRRD